MWGQRYAAGSRQVEFEAVRQGEYYLWPVTARFANGQSVVSLSAGVHALEVVSSEDFVVVWKPRDAKIYPVLEDQKPENFLAL